MSQRQSGAEGDGPPAWPLLPESTGNTGAIFAGLPPMVRRPFLAIDGLGISPQTLQLPALTAGAASSPAGSGAGQATAAAGLFVSGGGATWQKLAGTRNAAPHPSIERSSGSADPDTFRGVALAAMDSLQRAALEVNRLAGLAGALGEGQVTLGVLAAAGTASGFNLTPTGSEGLTSLARRAAAVEAVTRLNQVQAGIVQMLRLWNERFLLPGEGPRGVQAAAAEVGGGARPLAESHTADSSTQHLQRQQLLLQQLLSSPASGLALASGSSTADHLAVPSVAPLTASSSALGERNGNSGRQMQAMLYSTVGRSTVHEGFTSNSWQTQAALCSSAATGVSAQSHMPPAVLLDGAATRAALLASIGTADSALSLPSDTAQRRACKTLAGLLHSPGNYALPMTHILPTDLRMHESDPLPLHCQDSPAPASQMSPSHAWTAQSKESTLVQPGPSHSAQQLRSLFPRSSSQGTPKPDSSSKLERCDSETLPSQKGQAGGTLEASRKTLVEFDEPVLHAAHDGYKWFRCGRKIIKGADYPRQYYKCSDNQCPARKQMQLLRREKRPTPEGLKDVWVAVSTYDIQHSAGCQAPLGRGTGDEQAECPAAEKDDTEADAQTLQGGSLMTPPTASSTDGPSHQHGPARGSSNPRSTWARALLSGENHANEDPQESASKLKYRLRMEHEREEGDESGEASGREKEKSPLLSGKRKREAELDFGHAPDDQTQGRLSGRSSSLEEKANHGIPETGLAGATLDEGGGTKPQLLRLFGKNFPQT